MTEQTAQETLRRMIEDAILERAASEEEIEQFLARLDTWIAAADPNRFKRRSGFGSEDWKRWGYDTRFFVGTPNPFSEEEEAAQRQWQEEAAQRQWQEEAERIYAQVTRIASSRRLSHAEQRALGEVTAWSDSLNWLREYRKGEESAIERLHASIAEWQERCTEMETLPIQYAQERDPLQRKEILGGVQRDFMRTVTTTEQVDGVAFCRNNTISDTRTVFIFPRALQDDIAGLCQWGKSFYEEGVNLLKEIRSQIV